MFIWGAGAIKHQKLTLKKGLKHDNSEVLFEHIKAQFDMYHSLINLGVANKI